ncbi:Collectin-11 [Branchiostoma belcheri]|nr:Collectin-11 [Branchiostoma belcheri]
MVRVLQQNQFQNMVITMLLDQTKKIQEQIEERDKIMQERMEEQDNKMQEQMEERDKMQEQMEERDKEMQRQIKNLKLDLCLTKKTCCNKTEACPCGYEQFSERPDKCYKISTDVKYYTDARSDCQAAGGHLAMPKDKATNDFLAKLANSRFGDDMLIGLTDEVTEGTWVWGDGKILGTGWTNWAQGYPTHNDHLRNYAALSVGASNYEWYDLYNISGEYYICEVKATAAP